MEFAFFWVVFSLLVGALSRSRGHSFIAGTLFALILSPLVAGLIVLIRKPNVATIEARTVHDGEFRKCPFCAELIRREAIRCKHCGADIPSETKPDGHEEAWGDP